MGNGVRACGAHPTRPQTAADKSDEERLPEFQVAFALQTSAAV
ncbi:hypothetical protein [Eikenella halliae]|nr:hypothetical protein [Eikenella halliae]